jgi:hypothetical protein
MPNVSRDWTTLNGNYEVLDLSEHDGILEIRYIYSYNRTVLSADNASAIEAIHAADRALVERYR